MTKSSPLLLLVATLCLVILALSAFWIGLMPQRLLASLAHQLKLEHGVVLDARSPRMSFDGGPVLTLQAVSVGGDKAFDLTARDLKVTLGYASLFGGKVSPARLDFGAPVITLDVSAPALSAAPLAPVISVNDASIRLLDSRTNSTLALNEVNGTLSTASALKLDLSFIQNGNLSTLVADVEDAERFMEGGSPADITLSSHDKIFSFSGRAKWKSALQLDGQLNAEGAEAQATVAWAGMPLDVLKATGEFKLNSGLSTDGLAAQLSKLTAQIGGQDITGEATLRAGRDRAALSANVVMPTVSALAATNTLASPWTEAPLAFNDLTALDADIHIKTEKLSLRHHNWGQSDITLKLDGGAANLTVQSSSISLRIKATSSATDLSLAAKSADITSLIGGLTGFDRITGTGDLTVKATANGNSFASLVSSLKGSATLSSSKLSIPVAGFDTSGEGWTAGTSELNALFEAQINDGIASLIKADMTLGERRIKLKGDVDLLRQAFDLRLTPGKVQAIKGPWNNPLFTVEAGAAPPLRPAATPGN